MQEKKVESKDSKEEEQSNDTKSTSENTPAEAAVVEEKAPEFVFNDSRLDIFSCVFFS